MKNKIFGVLIALVLAVTGFGLVGCGGGSNPAPGPGPEPAPEVSYDDDTTPVDVDGSGFLFDLWTVERMEEDGWWDYPDYNQAFVYAITEEAENLVIPAYVTDGENEYRVTYVYNLVCTIDNVENHNYIGVNEQAQSVKTITIPSTVEEFYGIANWYDHQEDPEDEESEWISEPVYMENLESIILNNRTTDINLRYAANDLMDAILEIEDPEGNFTEEERDAVYVTVLNQFCTYDEENDMYYIGNPSNPYMLLLTAGDSYWEELPEGEFEIVANVNEDCKVIGNYAFGNSNITGVVLPEGLKTIGQGAFNNCYYLTEVELPDGLKYIGSEAFFYCNDLEYIEIPTTVEYIGWHIVSEGTVLYVDHDLVEYLPDCGALVVYVLKTLVDAAEEGVYPFDNYEPCMTYDEEAEENVARIETHNNKEYYGFCIPIE